MSPPNRRAAEAALPFRVVARSSCLNVSQAASTRALGASTPARRISSGIHGGGHEAIGVALLGDIADARERDVIADERELILHRHVETPLARLGGHPGIG